MLIVEKELTQSELEKFQSLKEKLKKIDRLINNTSRKINKLLDEREDIYKDLEDLISEALSKKFPLETDKIVLDLRNKLIFVEENINLRKKYL